MAVPLSFLSRIVNVKWVNVGAILVGGANATEPSAKEFDRDGDVLHNYPLPDWLPHDEVHFPGYPDQPVDTLAIVKLPNGSTAIGYDIFVNKMGSVPDLQNDSDALIVFNENGSRVWSDLSPPDYDDGSFRGVSVASLAADSDSNIYAAVRPLHDGEQSFLQSYLPNGGARWSPIVGDYRAVSCSAGDVIVACKFISSSASELKGFSKSGTQLWTRSIDMIARSNILSRNRNSDLMAIVDYVTVSVFDPATGNEVWSANPATGDDFIAGVDFGDDGTLYILIDNYPSSGPVVTRIEKYTPVVDGGVVQSYTLATTYSAILTDAGGDGYEIGGSFYNITDSAGLIFSNGLLLCGHADSSFHAGGAFDDWTEFAFSVHAFQADTGEAVWSADWGTYTLGSPGARLPQWAAVSALGS